MMIGIYVVKTSEVIVLDGIELIERSGTLAKMMYIHRQMEWLLLLFLLSSSSHYSIVPCEYVVYCGTTTTRMKRMWWWWSMWV